MYSFSLLSIHEYVLMNELIKFIHTDELYYFFIKNVTLYLTNMDKIPRKCLNYECCIKVVPVITTYKTLVFVKIK